MKLYTTPPFILTGDLLESPFLLGISDPQSSGLSSLKGDAKPGGLRLTPDGFAVVALQLASWFLF